MPSPKTPHSQPFPPTSGKWSIKKWDTRSINFVFQPRSPPTHYSPVGWLPFLRVCSQLTEPPSRLAPSSPPVWSPSPEGCPSLSLPPPTWAAALRPLTSFPTREQSLLSWRIHLTGPGDLSVTETNNVPPKPPRHVQEEICMSKSSVGGTAPSALHLPCPPLGAWGSIHITYLPIPPAHLQYCCASCVVSLLWVSAALPLPQHLRPQAPSLDATLPHARPLIAGPPYCLCCLCYEPSTSFTERWSPLCIAHCLAPSILM